MNKKCIHYSLATLCVSPMLIGAGLMIFADNEDTFQAGVKTLEFTPLVWGIIEIAALCYQHCHIDHHDNNQVALVGADDV